MLLNNGKAVDRHGLKAEHLKLADVEIIPHLTILRPVAPLSDAYILPIHKKGKNRLLTDNYHYSDSLKSDGTCHSIQNRVSTTAVTTAFWFY
jgi:hypothetical protein